MVSGRAVASAWGLIFSLILTQSLVGQGPVGPIRLGHISK
jgi:hypothetical protein